MLQPLLCVPAFQKSLFPARSLLPERFRGPVAPSAADADPLSPAPGGWDGGTLAESAGSFKDGIRREADLAIAVSPDPARTWARPTPRRRAPRLVPRHPNDCDRPRP